MEILPEGQVKCEGWALLPQEGLPSSAWPGPGGHEGSGGRGCGLASGHSPCLRPAPPVRITATP